jgi:hypothetical protein
LLILVRITYAYTIA